MVQEGNSSVFTIFDVQEARNVETSLEASLRSFVRYVLFPLFRNPTCPREMYAPPCRSNMSWKPARSSRRDSTPAPSAATEDDAKQIVHDPSIDSEVKTAKLLCGPAKSKVQAYDGHPLSSGLEGKDWMCVPFVCA